MNKIFEDLKKIVSTKFWVVFVSVLGAILVIVLVFSAGVMVGFHKATFGRDWGEHYRENFGMGYGGPMRNFKFNNPESVMGRFPNPNGAIGKVLKIELPNITIQDKDGIEKIVTLTPDTSILMGDKKMSQADLKIDDFVVIIGAPNNKGIIDAKFLRVLPAPDFLNK